MQEKSSQEILIQYIEKYRAEHVLSYKELATRLNIPYTTLTEMLHKKRVPRIDTIDILAKAMGVETYELFLPLTGRKENEKADMTYEEEILTAIHKMPEKKRKLLMLYVNLLEESDSG